MKYHKALHLASIFSQLLLQGKDDHETIGLLLCKGKNKVLAEYILNGYNHPIEISEYQISRAIPEGLKSQLPDNIELENELIKEE